MKKLLFVLLTGIFLVSCTQKEVTTPGAANQNVALKNSNVEVQDLKAAETSDSVITVSFSTTYENNINRIELMSSTDANTFCSTQAIDNDSNSGSLKLYSFKDSNFKGSTMHYMLRFRDNTGNWFYTNYCTVTVK